MPLNNCNSAVVKEEDPENATGKKTGDGGHIATLLSVCP
jgi:hypothetical protein